MHHNKRQMPADFPQVALTMPRHDLKKHYGASERIVRRWCDEASITKSFRVGRPGCGRRPMPDDFTQLAPTMCRMDLSRHYRASSELIMRWIRETGVNAKPYIPTPPTVTRTPQPRKLKLAPSRVRSIYDEAADDLRRERFPVNRCDEKGLFDPKGDYWRVGWSVLTPDDLLLRAAKYRMAA